LDFYQFLAQNQPLNPKNDNLIPLYPQPVFKL